ncbi:T9SS type A sorting domain-containing protein [candidate division KSB1 bacterium]|nr:T9SS type A sorting domain-containing protein [candidate division KSB1 bacterium]
MLPIGLNWGKTHTPVSASEDEEIAEDIKKPNTQTLKMNITGSTKQNQICWVEFVVEGATNLFGISFEMSFSPKTYIDSVEVENGSWLGDDILFFPNVNMLAGKVSLGITRKTGQRGINGSGVIATIKIKLKDIPPVETTLTIQNVIANDETGNSIQFDVENTTITKINEKTAEHIPTSFELGQNYPNPFNPTTTIEFAIPKSSQVSLRLYDLLGREVATLVEKEMQPGEYHIVFDAQRLQSGVYMYSLKAGDFFQLKKLLLLK